MQKQNIDYYSQYINSIGQVERDLEVLKLSGGKLIIKTIFADNNGFVWDLYERRDEWEAIDRLVFAYQRQFKENASALDMEIADAAGVELLERFYPLFKKYLIVLTTGQINFKNMEQKQFVRMFVDTNGLKHALNMKKPPRDMKEAVVQKFNFIYESYGKQDECEILADLQMLFFVLVKRYRDVGKSFCCYIYNSFKFEVARWIKTYIKNPSNFHYKVAELNEEEIHMQDTGYELVEDDKHETPFGSPDLDWIIGTGCSELFADFSPLDRKIFVKYYLEDWNDAQIAEMMGVHINTANQRRKTITQKLASKVGISIGDIKRHRKSGKNSNTDVAS